MVGQRHQRFGRRGPRRCSPARRTGATWLALVGLVGGAALLPSCGVALPDRAQFLAERCSVRVATAASVDALDIVAILAMTTATGSDDAAGIARARAIQLGVNEANSRQGVRGRTFRLRICDCGGATGETALVAAELAAAVVADSDAPPVLLTGGTADTLAVQAATQAKGTLVMSISATSPDITGVADAGLLWRVAPSDRVQGLALVYLLEKAGAKRVVVFARADSYGDGLSATVSKNAPADMDVTVVPIVLTDASITKALSFADGKTPDHVVLIGSSTLGARLLNGFKNHAHLLKPKLLLSDFLKRTDIFAQLNDSKQLEGALGTTPGDPPGDVFDDFNDRFKQLFSVDATQQSFTAHAYDATWCVILAHAWALRDGATPPVNGLGLADGLRQLSLPGGVTVTFEPTAFSEGRKALLAGQGINVQGASGALDFDPAIGEPTSAVEVWKVSASQVFVPQYWLRADETAGRAAPTWTRIPPPKK